MTKSIIMSAVLAATTFSNAFASAGTSFNDMPDDVKSVVSSFLGSTSQAALRQVDRENKRVFEDKYFAYKAFKAEITETFLHPTLHPRAIPLAEDLRPTAAADFIASYFSNLQSVLDYAVYKNIGGMTADSTVKDLKGHVIGEVSARVCGFLNSCYLPLYAYVEKVHAEEGTQINLSNQWLEFVPTNLGQCASHLEQLDLGSNSLITLHDGVYELTNLKRLNLATGSRHLPALDDGIANLENLEHFFYSVGVSESHILPQALIHGCPKLRELNTSTTHVPNYYGSSTPNVMITSAFDEEAITKMRVALANHYGIEFDAGAIAGSSNEEVLDAAAAAS